jgi:predicted AlkP superfamily phosphohydrolase/phosphomutase
MTRTIVLGLDGANWPLVEPWIEAGDLPNLAALREEAAWGPLTSQLPPVTSPNWRCYATGRNPAKLGVFWWEIVDRKQRAIRHPTARDFHTRPLWDELADTGKNVAVLNFPSGYPPVPIQNGRFTAGGPGAKDTGFTFPAEWEAELRHRYNYRVHPADVLRSARQIEARLDEILSLMQSRFDVAFDLLDEGLDFLHLTIFYINVLHHYCYQGRPSRAGWQLIDCNLGRLRLAAEGGYNLLLMSDHGSAPVDTVFFINTWLAQEDYLKINLPTVARCLSRWGLDRRRLAGMARRSGLAPLLRRLLPGRLQRALPGASGAFRNEAKGASIGWDHSLAVASGQGPIYLMLSSDHPDYEPLRNEIAAKLSALRNPTTGQPVVARVLRREEVYSGPFFDRAPDLIFEQGPGIHTSGGVGHPQVFEAPEKWAADNVLEGLFLAWGPDFAQKGHFEGTRIIDLAPTILHVMGAPVPDDMDGRVLSELLAPDSEAARRPVAFRIAETQTTAAYTPEDEAEIAARLTALGYLD